LGQPSTDTLKELYKNSEKASSGLRIGLLPAIQNCTATSVSWRQAKCVVMKCTFEHQGMLYETDAKTPENYRGGKY
jgi:ribosomal protein S6--L-glutamate ligase